MRKIILERTGDGWQAYFEGVFQHHTSGMTQAEAVGNLIINYADYMPDIVGFGIERR